MSRWHILKNKESIIWDENFDGHGDYLEMSGLRASLIVHYGTDTQGRPELRRHVVFPSLRTRPNDTHASFQCDIAAESVPVLRVDGEAQERVLRFVLDGNLHMDSVCGGAQISRMFFPSVSSRACFEYVSVKNVSGREIAIATDRHGRWKNASRKGCMGICISEVAAPSVEKVLAPGERYEYYIEYSGRRADEKPELLAGGHEKAAREMRIRELKAPMQLDTGEILDTMFAFAKIRAGESVFQTMNGLIHCPGGESYYAAVWCNDQVEYSGPWFAFTGDRLLNQAAANAYRWYLPFMDETYAAIPSSIIAEGMDYWDGAGDRGDAAMYLYGASHYCLTRGDKEEALRLWPAIQWCAEYCRRRQNEQGVIASDSDELENRFPSGDANLCTSVLCYMGLKQSACLAKEFGDHPLAAEYCRRAAKLEEAIEGYFGAEVDGYHTYRYYDGNTLLRSWICMPLCAGIERRAEGTADALLGPELMTGDGLLTQEQTDTVWDRSTLYGLRGLFRVGNTGRGFAFLQDYCATRLLGERVPYAIEAYPEGAKRHLSGESALFGLIVLLGILGIVPQGFDRFEMCPTLPEKMDHLYLENIHAFGKAFNIYVEKDGWRVCCDGREFRGQGRGTVVLGR